MKHLLLVFSVLTLSIFPSGKKVQFQNPAAMGLGGAGIALCQNTFGVYQNPAAVSKFRETYDLIAAGQAADQGVLSLAVADSYVSPVNAYIKYDLYLKKNIKSSHDLSFYLGYTVKKVFSFGLDATWYSGNLFSTNKTIWSFSPGLLFKHKAFSIGTVLKDSLVTRKGSRPISIESGFAISLSNITIAADVNYHHTRGYITNSFLEPHVGVQIKFTKIFSLKLGYHLTYNNTLASITENTPAFGLDIGNPYQSIHLANEFNITTKKYTFSALYRFILRAKGRGSS